MEIGNLSRYLNRRRRNVRIRELRKSAREEKDMKAYQKEYDYG